jgi:hypothetical protein
MQIQFGTAVESGWLIPSLDGCAARSITIINMVTATAAGDQVGNGWDIIHKYILPDTIAYTVPSTRQRHDSQKMRQLYVTLAGKSQLMNEPHDPKMGCTLKGGQKNLGTIQKMRYAGTLECLIVRRVTYTTTADNPRV